VVGIHLAVRHKEAVEVVEVNHYRISRQNALHCGKYHGPAGEGFLMVVEGNGVRQAGRNLVVQGLLGDSDVGHRRYLDVGCHHMVESTAVAEPGGRHMGAVEEKHKVVVRRLHKKVAERLRMGVVADSERELERHMKDCGSRKSVGEEGFDMKGTGV